MSYLAQQGLIANDQSWYTIATCLFEGDARDIVVALGKEWHTLIQFRYIEED